MIPAPPRAASTPAPIAGPGVPPEQTRARYPDASGFVERDGTRIFYEIYGSGEPTVVFVPPWQIVHSRVWKAQIPDFARRHRVVAWDARGNGRSDRPCDPAAHTSRMRASGLARAIPGARLELLAGSGHIPTARHPMRVNLLIREFMRRVGTTRRDGTTRRFRDTR